MHAVVTGGHQCVRCHVVVTAHLGGEARRVGRALALDGDRDELPPRERERETERERSRPARGARRMRGGVV